MSASDSKTTLYLSADRQIDLASDATTIKIPAYRGHVELNGHDAIQIARALNSPSVLIEFSTSNAAFEENTLTETARILRALADKIDGADFSGKVRDINGNVIGSFSVEV